MVSVINDNEEYDAIMAILLKLPFGTDLNIYQVFRLHKKAEHFLILNDMLYLNIREGLYKKVFYKTRVDTMALEVKRLYDINHWAIIGCMNYVRTISLQYPELL